MNIVVVIGIFRAYFRAQGICQMNLYFTMLTFCLPVQGQISRFS